MKLSKNFTLYELTKSATAERKGIDNTPPDDMIEKLKYLCETILEPIRKHYKRPITPNSGWRGKKLNKAVGGASKSQHCKAEAVDIEIPGISNYNLACWCRDNLDFDQIILECYTPGIPNSGWVHISTKKEGNRHKTLTYSGRKYFNGFII